MGVTLAVRLGPRALPTAAGDRMELIHTCYRIGDIDRSVAFYEALGFEELRRMPIRDEAINVFMGLPGDGAALELTYNHGVDSLRARHRLQPHRAHRRRSRRDAGRPRRPGHRAREAAVHGERGRLADLLRARSRRLPDRAHRARLGLTAVVQRGRRSGSRSSTSAPTRSGSSSSRARRRTPGSGGSASTRSTSRCASAPASTRPGRSSPSRWRARSQRSRSSRTSAARRAERDEIHAVATSAIRDATNPSEFLERARERSGLEIRGALARGGGPRRLPGGRQLDRRCATAPCSTSAAGRCSSSRSRGCAARRWSRGALGAVRMTERFLPDGPAKPKQLKALRAHVRASSRARRG